MLKREEIKRKILELESNIPKNQKDYEDREKEIKQLLKKLDPNF